MNATKVIVFSSLTAFVMAIGYAVMMNHPSEQRTGIIPLPSSPKAVVATAALASPTTQTSAIESETVRPVAETVVATNRPLAQKKIAATQASKPAKVKPPVQDPDARAALSLVGADPLAEQYWAAAINDPNLPANERKDLIEDLNEDGLSDPKHPGPQDLPLIANRLRLIEELAPSAMDAVNADAFAEAYKDLQNLAAGGTAQ